MGLQLAPPAPPPPPQPNPHEATDFPATHYKKHAPDNFFPAILSVLKIDAI